MRKQNSCMKLLFTKQNKQDEKVNSKKAFAEYKFVMEIQFDLLQTRASKSFSAVEASEIFRSELCYDVCLILL